MYIYYLRQRRPPRYTRTDTRFPYTTLFRSSSKREIRAAHAISGRDCKAPDASSPHRRADKWQRTRNQPLLRRRTQFSYTEPKLVAGTGGDKIRRAHLLTPVTYAHFVFPFLLVIKKLLSYLIYISTHIF